MEGLQQPIYSTKQPNGLIFKKFDIVRTFWTLTIYARPIAEKFSS